MRVQREGISARVAGPHLAEASREAACWERGRPGITDVMSQVTGCGETPVAQARASGQGSETMLSLRYPESPLCCSILKGRVPG